MGIDKDAFNNLAWSLRMLEENQDEPEAELITASYRQLQGVLTESAIEFDDTVFEGLEGLGKRELVKQVSGTRAIYKRPEKRWVGGGWDVYQENYWRLEVADAAEPSELVEPEYSVTIMPSPNAGSDVFEEGVMPKIHVVDIVFDGHRFPLGGHLHVSVYTEPRVQSYLDDMIDSLTG